MIDQGAVHDIPLGRLREALLDLFGLTISEGALVDMLSAGAAPLKVAVSLIKARLLGGTAIASDETGGRVSRADWCLWVFHHGDSAAFVADAHRSKAVGEASLGDHRPDIWTSDRLGAPSGWARKEHQVCLAHLIRDVRYVIEAGDAVLGPDLKRLLGRACAIGRRRKSLETSTQGAYKADLVRRLDRILAPDPTQSAGLKPKRMTLKVRSNSTSSSRTGDPEATNNGSERALRPCAVYR